MSVDGCMITVNAGSYTIITAHREFLRGLLKAMYEELPAPKKKK